MVRTLTATELKAKLLALLDDVAAGDEIVVTKHGRVVARLTPASGGPALRGRYAGAASSAAADEDLFGTGATWEAS